MHVAEKPESLWFASRYIGAALGRGTFYFMLPQPRIYGGHYS